MSTESELEALKKGLKGEQKRGFDARQGALSLFHGFSETVALNDSLSAQQKGDAKHPVLSDTAAVVDGKRETLFSSAAFLVDTARVGMCDLA